MIRSLPEFFRRRGLLAALAILGALGAAGCQTGICVADDCPIRHIFLEHPEGPLGYLLETSLRPSLQSEAPYTYRLTIRLQEDQSTSNIDVGGLPIRQRTTIRATLLLDDLATHTTVLTTTIEQGASFNIALSPPTTEINRQTAQRNTLENISRQIVIAVTTFLARQKTQKQDAGAL